MLALSVCAGAALLAPSEARADTQRDYVAKLVLVLDGLTRALAWTETNSGNPELARVAHTIAQMHVQLARRLTPPPELRHAHPHLLIVAENVERAIDAAARDDLRQMRAHARTAREEMRTLDAIFEHLRVRLPHIR